MKQLVLVLGAVASLAACSSGPEGKAWYEQGDANYDALKAAHDACAAKGGTYQVKSGGDPTHLGDYECVGATK
ncbi:MAG TPA: hypothetical protein VME40_10670 [Caulobacteraceae bacterium]|nr:hypothetical protein [Caulobacteraceae bacterium]